MRKDKRDYIVIKQLEEYGGAVILNVFIGAQPDEILDMTKKEHRKYMLV